MCHIMQVLCDTRFCLGFQRTSDSRERLNDVALPTQYKLNERHFVNNVMKKANDGGISGTGTG